jgi:hypothetical protein
VAKKIVFECGVSEDHARKSSPLFVIQRAMDHSSNENACEKFHAMLHRHVSPAVASELNSLFVQVIELEKRKLISHLSSTDHVEETKEDNGIQSAPVSLKTAKRGGDNDLASRFEVKKNNGIDILVLLEDIQKQVPDNMELLTNGARTWFISCVKPVLGCLKYHFNDDKTAFMVKYHLKKGISRFKKTCCAGSDSSSTCSI